LSRNVARRYVAETLIATEHGLLDDNGDGRGSELQRDYLSEEEGGRARRGTPPKPQAGRDGALSSGIPLPFAVPPKPEPTKPAETPSDTPKEPKTSNDSNATPSDTKSPSAPPPDDGKSGDAPSSDASTSPE
jgi:hypothetical protein